MADGGARVTRLQRPGLPTATQLLNHLFENPTLLAAVRELPSPTLGGLINSVGLEDAAELVALATTKQLTEVFDEDLWQLEQGDWEERFDPARFALWLRAFSEAGEDAVVTRLIELPLQFVILAVHRLILVLDIDSLALEMSDNNDNLDMIEKALDSCLYEEWEEFRLIARDDLVWDELTHALFTLDRDHHALLRQVLERCAALSSEWIEDNGGLYAVLTSDEMLEADVRAERDDRRAQKGFVSKADARAFLELARRDEVEATVRDAITKAYFRGLVRKPDNAKIAAKTRSGSTASNVAGLVRLLEEARIIEPTPGARRPTAQTKRITSGAAVKSARRNAPLRLLDGALTHLHHNNPDCYRERMEELAYLANVLIAAPQNHRQTLRPIEALESALQITDRGLELVLGAKARQPYEESLQSAIDLLTATTADHLFRRGYCETATKSQKLSPLPESVPRRK